MKLRARVFAPESPFYYFLVSEKGFQVFCLVQNDGYLA